MKGGAKGQVQLPGLNVLAFTDLQTLKPVDWSWILVPKGASEDGMSTCLSCGDELQCLMTKPGNGLSLS